MKKMEFFVLTSAKRLTRCPARRSLLFVDDRLNRYTIFSRVCPEYTIKVNETTHLLLLVNHFKSKGYGTKADSDARRKKQAKRVREIYDLRRSQGIDKIAIVGDFNDTPDSDPL